tara:strand:- start:205 stop:519 length:315 start_codon:yes stop_codon:yes gene_type:complete
MELTGKAKEQFEKWYLERYFKKLIPLSMQEKFAILDSFDEIYNAMKWGVYQDFADSLGVEIYAEKSLCREGFVSLTDSYPCGYFNTRNEARSDAINKLNELLNK